MMRIRRIDHVSFAVGDLTATSALLQRLLGLPLTLDAVLGTTRKVLLDAGNAKVELLHSPDATSRTGAFLAARGPGFFHLCFEVDDVADAARTLAEQGVGLLDAAPLPTVEGGLAIFADPAATGGVLLEFKQAAP
jgi:methylmalonyl-CoA/ethylmalonyl-CoA epimerase